MPRLLALSLLLASSCQSRSEFLLEKGRAEISRSLKEEASVTGASFEFERIDAQLRIERGKVEGLPAKEARARFHAFVAEELDREFSRLGCISGDRDEAMLATVAPSNASLAAKWAALKDTCRKQAGEAREVRAQAVLEKARDKLLLISKPPVDVLIKGCAAGAVAKVTKHPVVTVDADELATWDELTAGEASKVALGRATLTVEDHKVTRETRKMISKTLVSSEQVTVALSVDIDIAENGKPPRHLGARWAVSESGKEELEPLKISTHADLWAWLCRKLEAEASSQ